MACGVQTEHSSLIKCETAQVFRDVNDGQRYCSLKSLSLSTLLLGKRAATASLLPFDDSVRGKYTVHT